MKKQQTEWIFTAKYQKGDFIKVGYIHNKNTGNLKDVIRLFIKGKKGHTEYDLRPDEAMCVAGGLSKTMAILLLRGYFQRRKEM